MRCKTSQDGQVIVESADKTWPAAGGNGKPLQYSCHENATDSTQRQKDMTPEDELPRSEGVQHVAGEERRAITNGSRLGRTPGDGEGQGGLVCCHPWGRKQSGTT